MTSTGPARPARRARRRVRHSWSYGPVLRPADRRSGTRDGRSASGRSGAGRTGTPWTDRLSATWQENDARTLAQTADRLGPVVRRLRHAFGEVERGDRALAEVRGDVPPGATSEPVVRRGEAHLTTEELAGRRARERAVVLAAQQARAEAARSDRDAALAECLTLRAELAEEFELAQELSSRMRWYYTRRLHTYARAFWAAAAPDVAPVGLDALPPSAWAGLPCPWFPEGLDARLDAGARPGPAAAHEGADR